MKSSIKKLFAAATAASLMIVGIASVSAQDDAERPGRGPGGRFGGELAQEYTGLSSEAIREALMNGSTLAELIEANGASVDDYVDAAVAAHQERLDDAVAAGRIDQAAADERAAALEEHITERLNGEFTPGEGGFRGGRPGHGPRGDGEFGPRGPQTDDDSGEV
jgi:hypothetical protein